MNNLFLNLKKDQFIHGRKRKETTKKIIVTVTTIIGSVIVACLIGAMFGYNPFTIFADLLSKGFISPLQLIYSFGTFALAGLAFSFASKAGIFNIGISGQMITAGLVIISVTNALQDVNFPAPLGQIFILFLAITSAGLMALIMGALESYLKVNSVVSGILINWIMFFISIFVIATYYNNSEGNVFTGSIEIPQQFRITGSAAMGNSIIPIIILVLIVSSICFFLTKYTIFGHKIKAIGLSQSAAKYAGYNIKIIRLATFFISGAIAGILATVIYTTNQTAFMSISLSSVVVPSAGFDGIAIGLIASNNPIAIIFVALFIGLLQASGPYLEPLTTFNQMILGVIMLGAAITMLLYNYKPWKHWNEYRYSYLINKSLVEFDNKKDSLISKYFSILSVNKKEFKMRKKNEVNAREFEYLSEILLTVDDKEIDSSIIYEGKDKHKEELILLNKKYLMKMNELKEEFEYIKISDLIKKKINPKIIIVALTEQINYGFDIDLTKILSKIRNKKYSLNVQKELLEKGVSESKVQKIKKIDDKLIKLDLKIEKNITQSKKLSNNEILKIEKKYNYSNIKIEKNIKELTTLINRSKIKEQYKAKLLLEMRG